MAINNETPSWVQSDQAQMRTTHADGTPIVNTTNVHENRAKRQAIAANIAQAQADARPADGMGALRDNQPLVAGETLIGASRQPPSLSRTQYNEVAHKADANVVLPPFGADKNRPIPAPQTPNQARNFVKNVASKRPADAGLATDELASSAPVKSPKRRRSNPTQNEANRAALDQLLTQSKASVPVQNDGAHSGNAPIQRAGLAAPGARATSVNESLGLNTEGQPLASQAASSPKGIKRSADAAQGSNSGLSDLIARIAPLTAGTLGAANPASGGELADSAQTASTSDPASLASMPQARKTSVAPQTPAPMPGASGASDISASTQKARNDANTLLGNLSKADKKFVQQQNAALNAVNHEGHNALDEPMRALWAKVLEAGQHKDYSGVILNLQAFFNLIAAKNAELIGLFLLLEEQATILDNQISVQTLQLSRDATLIEQAFAQADALGSFARNAISFRDASTTGALRGMARQNPLLSATDLDLRNGLENQQLQGAVQNTFQARQIHQLAGDTQHKPVLPDETGESDIKVFQTAQHVQTMRTPGNENLTDAQVHDRVADYYRAHNDAVGAQDPAQKILTSFASTDGETTRRVGIERLLLAPSEIEGLQPNDKVQYKLAMLQVNLTRREDWGATAAMYRQEMATLRSAAKQTSDPAEALQLRARADELQPIYNNQIANVRGAGATIGGLERRYDEGIKTRAGLEKMRVDALNEYNNINTLVQRGAADTPADRTARALAIGRKEVYRATVSNLNWRCTIMDEELMRHADSKLDVKRGRWQTGAPNVANLVRDSRAGIHAAQARLATSDTEGSRTAARHEIEDHRMRLSVLDNMPPYFKNTVMAHENLISKLIKPPEGTQPATFVGGNQAHQILEAYKREIAAHPQQLQGVTNTRMLTHLKERQSALQSAPEDHPEKMAIQVLNQFWRDPALFGGKQGYAPPLAPNRGQAAWTNLKLRNERISARESPSPETLPSGPIEPMWPSIDGVQPPRPVNMADREEAERYWRARAAGGANIVAPMGADGTGGAYKNDSGVTMDYLNNVTGQWAQISHPDALTDQVTQSAEAASNDAQESRSEIVDAISQARQMTDNLIKQMIKLANASVGH